MVKVRGELDFSGEVKKVFLSTQADKFLQSEVQQFFLSGDVGKLESFVKKSFIKVESYLHRLIIGELVLGKMCSFEYYLRAAHLGLICILLLERV